MEMNNFSQSGATPPDSTAGTPAPSQSGEVTGESHTAVHISTDSLPDGSGNSKHGSVVAPGQEPEDRFDAG